MRIRTFLSVLVALTLLTGSAMAQALPTLPELPDNAVESTFESDGDVDIAYVKVVHPEEVGAVVISQGYTEQYAKWNEIINELYAQGFSVYALDHRGQGRSGRFGLDTDGQTVHVDSWSQYIQDMENFVNHVVKADPHEKMFLFGHSMGSAIAFGYLVENDKVFDGAVLVSPMFEPKSPNPGDTPEGMLAAANYYCSIGYCAVSPFSDTVYQPFPYVSQTLDGVTHDVDRYLAYHLFKTAHPEIVTSRPSFGWIREALLEGVRLQENASEVKTPVLMLQAGSDFYVNTAKQAPVCDAMENCQLLTFDMVIAPQLAPYGFDKPAHELHREVSPIRNLVMGAIYQFLNQ